MVRKFLLGLGVLASLHLSALAGLAELQAAATNCVQTMERLKKEAPTASTAPQAAGLLHDLAASLEQFATATATAKKDSPDLLKQQEPSPEMLEVYKRWTEVSGSMGPVMEQLGKVLQAHAQDPDVQKSAVELQAAVMHLSTAMQ